VYDHLQPHARQCVVREVPLLAIDAARQPSGRLAYRGHDLAHSAGEHRVPVLDVVPVLIGQNDAAPVWIECRPEHRSIVAAIV
jgi:hypothetical protein